LWKSSVTSLRCCCFRCLATIPAHPCDRVTCSLDAGIYITFIRKPICADRPIVIKRYKDVTHGFIFFTCKEHSHKRFHFTAHIILYHQLQKQGMIRQSSLLLWYCGTRIFASHQGREIFVSGSSASSVLDSASVSYSSCKHVSIPYSNRSTLVRFELTEVNNNV